MVITSPRDVTACHRHLTTDLKKAAPTKPAFLPCNGYAPAPTSQNHHLHLQTRLPCLYRQPSSSRSFPGIRLDFLFLSPCFGPSLSLVDHPLGTVAVPFIFAVPSTGTLPEVGILTCPGFLLSHSLLPFVLQNPPTLHSVVGRAPCRPSLRIVPTVPFRDLSHRS